jgi:ATP-binding cassette subfamily B protein
MNLPAIAHIVTEKGLNHFVVIYKITNKSVYIMDPAKGYIKEDIDEFKNKWTKVILLFKPYKKIPYTEQKDLLKEIALNIITSNKNLLIKTIILNFLITLFSIILSYYIKFAIDSIDNYTISYLYILILIFGLLSFYKIILNYIKNELSNVLNKNIDCTIIPDFLEHILNLPSEVITSHTSGEILTRINELKNIKELFSEIIISLLLNVTLCLSSIIFLISINKTLFLILCLIAFVYILVSIATNQVITDKINETIDSEANFNSYLVENIETIESIKNLNIIEYKKDNIFKEYIKYIKNIFNFNNLMNMILGIKNMINELGLFIITSYGLTLIINKDLTLVGLITFNTLLSYFLEPIENCMNELPKLNRIRLSVEKIKEFLSIEEELKEVSHFKNGDIKINNLEYSYNNYDKTLDKVSLVIKENDRVEIKGRSGCGKSTICKIINKTINDYKGTIKINNIDLKDYSIKTIRNNILYVSQREKLYTDTIKNNIVLDKKVNLCELNKILEITKVDEIVNKKGLRLESILYDEGYNLSGGERQRIVLARSIIRKPQILIIDEALSEVEPSLAKNILIGISNYLNKSTIIYISHQKESVFKNIINMENTNVRISEI